MLLPQGKNINNDEFAAIGDMLATVTWELPFVEEYKNDLVQPEFLGNVSVPKAATTTIAVPQAKPDPNSPISEEQWKKVDKMVAWLRTSLFFTSL